MLIIDKFAIIHRGWIKNNFFKRIHLVTDDGLYDRRAFYKVKIVVYSSSMQKQLSEFATLVQFCFIASFTLFLPSILSRIVCMNNIFLNNLSQSHSNLNILILCITLKPFTNLWWNFNARIQFSENTISHNVIRWSSHEQE